MKPFAQMKKIATTALASACLIGAYSSGAHADEYSATSVRCEGRGGQLVLSYASTSFSGIPLLNIVDSIGPGQKLTVTSVSKAPEFSTTETAIGKLVTYVVDAAKEEKVSFILPLVVVHTGEKPLQFKSLAIYKNLVSSRHAGSAVPRKLQWSTIAMDCSLSAVIP